VLRFVSAANGDTLHRCLKELGHPGRHSDGERAWETEPNMERQYRLPDVDDQRGRGRHKDGGQWT
jgi:hypothetical protein